VRYHYPNYWQNTGSGNQDWFGQRAPYPTRLTLTTVALDRDDLGIDESSVITDFFSADGRHSSNTANMELKTGQKFLALSAGILEKGLKEKCLWSWK
jgi:hypothetical protein